MVNATATGLVLPRGDAPSEGRYQARSGASVFGLSAEVRGRPWVDATSADDTSLSMKGVWLGAGVGTALTGGTARFLLTGHVGYDVWLTPRLGLGPTASIVYVAQPDNSVRPEDAVIALLGVRLTLDPAPVPVGTPGLTPVPPPADRDGDDLEDARDRCPAEPEDRDGVEDQDGCPEDDDSDGVPDVADACRSVPEDRDGFQDEDGCPEADNDYDGVADKADRCPNEPEDRDGFEDEDGCPEPDNDQDGVSDAADRCPNEAETKNGRADGDGCPDEESVRVSGDEIVFDPSLSFVPDYAPVRQSSWGALEQLAKLLQRQPQYAQVTIEAYADGSGNAEQDRQLSEARAASVRQRLSQYGVEPERLVVVGKGWPQGTLAPHGVRSDVTIHITRHGAPGAASSPAEGAR